jgi:hypothetical protein
VRHASEEAEHAHLRAKWETTLGRDADAFVARAMARAAVIVTARKTPESYSQSLSPAQSRRSAQCLRQR